MSNWTCCQHIYEIRCAYMWSDVLHTVISSSDSEEFITWDHEGSRPGVELMLPWRPRSKVTALLLMFMILVPQTDYYKLTDYFQMTTNMWCVMHHISQVTQHHWGNWSCCSAQSTDVCSNRVLMEVLVLCWALWFYTNTFCHVVKFRCL